MSENGAGAATGTAGAPTRRRRARRGEGDRLREEIVAAAIRMLDVSGEVGELSLRAVAREVGVATTSIYLHFRDLGELVLAVKTRYFEEFGAALDEAATAAGGDALARARARAHGYVRYGLANRGRYWAMFSSESLPAHLLPDVGIIGLPLFEAVRDEIAELVPEQDAQLLAIHVWTALHGVVMLRTLRPHFPWPDLNREVDDLLDRFLAATGRLATSGDRPARD